MELEKSIRIIKALGDSSRLLIINSLKEKSQYVEELARRLNLAESTVSFHLKKLESAGLVNKTKEQYYVTFHLNHSLFKTSLSELISIKNSSKTVQDERIRKYKENVIKTFQKKGKIEKLPAQYKKRILLYENLLRQFDANKVYLEKEVDTIISGVYKDYCTIRRAFIDEKMMIRKNGEYIMNKEYVLQFPSEIHLPKTKTEAKRTMDRNEIKRKYKIEGAPMGVYLITNIETGNKFLGSAKNLNGMINRHVFELKMRAHQIKDLQETYDKYGESKIAFKIIDKLERKEEPDYNYADDLKELENLWLEKFLSEGEKIFCLSNTRLLK